MVTNSLSQAVVMTKTKYSTVDGNPIVIFKEKIILVASFHPFALKKKKKKKDRLIIIYEFLFMNFYRSSCLLREKKCYENREGFACGYLYSCTTIQT